MTATGMERRVELVAIPYVRDLVVSYIYDGNEIYLNVIMFIFSNNRAYLGIKLMLNDQRARKLERLNGVEY